MLCGQKKKYQPRKKNPNHIFFRKIGLLRQTKKFTQPKRIYSANGNPFIPMICRFYAPLLFPNLCAIVINQFKKFWGEKILLGVKKIFGGKKNVGGKKIFWGKKKFWG